jgi:membrane protein
MRGWMRDLLARSGETYLGRVGRKFVADRAGDHAVLIAWNGLFSLFPITLALAAILGAGLSIAGVTNQEIDQTVVSFIPSQAGGDEMIHAVQGVKGHSGVFGLIALAGFLWGASGLFGALESSLSQILGVEPRPFLAGKLMALAMMVIFMILVTIGIASSTAVALLSNLQPPQHQFLIPLIETGAGLVAGFLLCFSIYYVVPNRQQSLGKVWPGALVAGAGFKLLTLLFPFYAGLNKGLTQYGATFALFFILLTFFYFLGLLLVFGAEINAIREQPRGRAI